MERSFILGNRLEMSLGVRLKIELYYVSYGYIQVLDKRWLSLV